MEYAVDPLNEYQSQMLSYWDLIRVEMENLKCDNAAFKTQDLPLARIKKIMKLDDDIKSMMISAEAPILFAKAAELFIRELTLRAWIHTERNRRRTLQRNDIAMSVSDGDTDQFDFLIDIVPREETRAHRRTSHTGVSGNATPLGGMDPSHHHHQHHLKTENLVTFATAGGTGNTTLQLVSTPSTSVAAASAELAAISTASSSVATAATGLQFVSSGNPQTSTAALVVAGGGANAGAGQIQYVLQLPSSVTGGQLSGANSMGAGQPFHIQLLPQQFQTSSTDVIAASSVAGSSGVLGGPETTMLTDVNGNSIPLVQVVSQAASGGLSLPIVHDANGGRAQILQLQETPAAATFLLPQHHQHVAYALQQPHLLAATTLSDLQHKEQQQVYHLSFAASNNDTDNTAIVVVNDESAQAMNQLDQQHQSRAVGVVELSEGADLLQSNGNSSPGGEVMMAGVEILTVEPPSSSPAGVYAHLETAADESYILVDDTSGRGGNSAADQ